MKNLIVFLIVLTNVSIAEAFTLWQYQISIAGPTNGSYTCKITPDNPWVQNDLITWIFPDGQMQQPEIQINNSTITGDVIIWSPCYNSSVNLNQIQVYVARKGGSGTPPPLSFVAPPSNLSTSAPATATAPATIDFPPGKNWKVEKSWGFSPGTATFLVFSYKQGTLPECNNSSVEITLPPGITEAGSLDFFDEVNEVINNSKRKILISSYSPNHRNYFLNLHTNSSIPVGQTIEIYIKGGFCTPSFVDTLRFVVEAEPHDPNKKTVDIDTIYNGHSNTLRLTYTIQFHNDGNDFVKKVVVTDEMPAGLNPATFHLLDAPAMNGLTLSNQTDFQNLYSSNAVKEIIFEGTNGLPGINQIGPSYAYDQTIYRFKFGIDTDPNFKSTINNDAKITFYNGLDTLPSILTAVVPVYIVDAAPPRPRNVTECCCNWSPFWCRFFNIFRHDKLRPCK